MEEGVRVVGSREKGRKIQLLRERKKLKE